MEQVTDSGGATQRTRWSLVALVFIVGAVLVFLAFWSHDKYPDSLASSAFLEVGAAVALAGLLFAVERHFVAVVRSETKRIEDRLDERAGDLESRMDTLEGATKARLTDRYRSQDESWSRLEDDASFETVTHALEAANDLQSLDGGTVDVQLDPADPYHGVRVTFEWGASRADGPPLRPRLTLSVTNLRSSGPGTPIVECEWKPEMSAAEAGAQLVHEMQRAAVYPGDDRCDWAFALRDLRRVLEIAIRGRRRSDGDGRALEGEFITCRREWIFTTGGIEHPDHGMVVQHDEFTAGRGVANVFQNQRSDFEPECPDWVTASDWRGVVDLGQQLYPSRGFANLGFTSNWIPMTTELRDNK